MEDVQDLNTGFYHQPVADYLPGLAPFDYSAWFDHDHHPNIQKIESRETIVLRSKLAIAESRVKELQKDKAEAKSVINYLLKLNAGASLQKASSYGFVACTSPQYSHDPRSAENVKDILSPVIAVLQGIIHAGPLDQGLIAQPTSPASLLDLFDEGPRSEDEAKGVEESSEASSTLFDCPKVTESVGASRTKITKDYVERTDALEPDLMIFEPDTSSTAPLVTRFCNARTEPGSRQDGSVKSSSTQSTKNPYGQIQTHLQKSSDESETAFSGSTQYDASQSDSASSASPISSFRNSDDDEKDHLTLHEDEKQPKSHYLVQDDAARAESNGFDEWDATTAASCAVNCNTLPGFPLSAKPQAAITALFMPKWRVLPYTMSALERADAISLHQRHAAEKEHSFPGFFRFGIRYRPDDAHAGNVFRTVLIDNLPPTRFALSTLLMQIKGGAVLDAKLLNTIGIHGRTSSMITFVHEEAAQALEARAHSHPFHFHFNGLQARVVLLPTPTWPMAPALQTHILHHRHTRCLQVHGFPHNSITPRELEQDLQHLWCRSLTFSHGGIEAKTLRADGVLELRFTSVLDAEMARRVLMGQHRYRHCVCEYLPDPCARPWDDDETVESADMDRGVCGKLPEDSNYGGTNVGAVPGWKEYACESYTGIPTLLEEARLENPEDRTFRLSDAEIGDSAMMQRGRGFSTAQSSVCKNEDTCNPQ
ncbi:MAG: hypothetical protein L6R36_005866 [Xanthoria steineri]|nr:MAG: hypothetical protein L6R36_005866 [Xanthoria steineri]